MKKIIVLLLGLIMVFSLAACGAGEQPNNSSAGTSESSADADTSEPVDSSVSTEAPSESTDPDVSTETPDGESNTLIVFFSWSSNTEGMAKTIQEQVGGTLYQIIPENAYPTDYTECTEVALAERDSNERPAIGNLPDSISEYDRIIIGYPIWWHTAPMIIGTFLESYDLAGVDIYPFVQSSSMNAEQFEASVEFVKECANGANVHDGLFARPSDTEAITSWLEANGLIGD